MKKTFKFAAIAIVASLTMIACNNNNQATEDTIDSTAIEQIAEDELIAEPVVAEVADTVKEETPAPTAKKPAVKKTPTTQKETVPTKVEKTDNIETTVNENAKEVGKGQKVEGRKKPTTL